MLAILFAYDRLRPIFQKLGHIDLRKLAAFGGDGAQGGVGRGLFHGQRGRIVGMPRSLRRSEVEHGAGCHAVCIHEYRCAFLGIVLRVLGEVRDHHGLHVAAHTATGRHVLLKVMNGEVIWQGGSAAGGFAVGGNGSCD